MNRAMATESKRLPEHLQRPKDKLETPPRSEFPEFMRVDEALNWSRLSKPKLYELIRRGLIKSVSLRERGQIKGTRLIVADSLREYLYSKIEGGNPKAA